MKAGKKNLSMDEKRTKGGFSGDKKKGRTKLDGPKRRQARGQKDGGRGKRREEKDLERTGYSKWEKWETH